MKCDDALSLRALFILAQTSCNSSAHPPNNWLRVVITTGLLWPQYFVRPPLFAMIAHITFGWLFMRVCQRLFFISAFIMIGDIHIWLIPDSNLSKMITSGKYKFFEKFMFFHVLHLKFDFHHQKSTSQKWCLEVRRKLS